MSCVLNRTSNESNHKIIKRKKRRTKRPEKHILSYDNFVQFQFDKIHKSMFYVLCCYCYVLLPTIQQVLVGSRSSKQKKKKLKNKRRHKSNTNTTLMWLKFLFYCDSWPLIPSLLSCGIVFNGICQVQWIFNNDCFGTACKNPLLERQHKQRP